MEETPTQPQTQPSIMCFECHNVQADCWCQQCDAGYCQSCYQNAERHSAPGLPAHVTIPICQMPILLASCTEHLNKNLKFWCLNCKVAVCDDCLTYQHQSHSHTDINTFVQEKASERKKVYIETQFCLYNAFKNALDVLTFHENTAMARITEVFNSIRSIVDDCEYRLKEKLLFIQENDCESVQFLFKQLQEKHEELKVKQSDMSCIASSNDLARLLEIHQETIQHLEKSKQELISYAHTVKPKYRIDGLTELQVSVSDAVRQVRTSKWYADIPRNSTWMQDGLTVAGGNNQGIRLHQLSFPAGIHIDDDQTIYIADCGNHRIVAWKSGSTRGRVVAGGYGSGNGNNQLNKPYDVTLDKKRHYLFISDRGNRRVVRWLYPNGTKGDIIISDVDCVGLTLDDRGFLFVVDCKRHEVRRYAYNGNGGTTVAGGNGPGYFLNQLSDPRYVFVDQYCSVYVSDRANHRIMKWIEGAKEGIIVAGSKGQGISVKHLSNPQGIAVDTFGTLYVVDTGNGRIMSWSQGSSHGEIILDGRKQVSKSAQLFYPIGLAFDRRTNLYVSDFNNHRIQKFNINFNSSGAH